MKKRTNEKWTIQHVYYEVIQHVILLSDFNFTWIEDHLYKSIANQKKRKSCIFLWKYPTQNISKTILKIYQWVRNFLKFQNTPHLSVWNQTNPFSKLGLCIILLMSFTICERWSNFLRQGTKGFIVLSNLK